MKFLKQSLPSGFSIQCIKKILLFLVPSFCSYNETINVSAKFANHYKNITRVLLLKSCNSSHPNLIKEKALSNFFALKKNAAITNTETSKAQKQQI